MQRRHFIVILIIPYSRSMSKGLQCPSNGFWLKSKQDETKFKNIYYFQAHFTAFYIFYVRLYKQLSTRYMHVFYGSLSFYKIIGHIADTGFPIFYASLTFLIGHNFLKVHFCHMQITSIRRHLFKICQQPLLS